MQKFWPYPRRPTSNLLLLAAGAALSGCGPAEPTNDSDAQTAAEEPVLNLPAVPVPEPPLDRAALLQAVAEAASAAAGGAADGSSQREFDGRQFEVRIRFGCRGPASDLQSATLGWSFNREDGTLRVRAMPTLSLEEPLVQTIAKEGFEAAEGFWVPRPWILNAMCPAAAAVRPAAPEVRDPDADAAEQTAAPQSDDPQETRSPPPAVPKVGIAQFFTEDEPRTRRRKMRPYETVKTIDPATPLGSQGFNLVLSGRLKALPNGRVVACETRSSDLPPECIISADFDRVWIERPESREVLAEWTTG